jgi:hypothetical protein
MQQIDKSTCGVFTIAYATNIAFGFNPKKSQYVLTQMQTHLQNSINTNTSFPSQNIYPSKKNNSSSLVEQNSVEPKCVNDLLSIKLII